MPRLKTIEWVEGAARILDQTRLPGDLVYCDIGTAEEMYEAIKILMIRGAPAIGIAAAFGVYCGVKDFPEDRPAGDLLSLVEQKADYLASSRPTAVNLSWAMDRVKKTAQSLVNLSQSTSCIKKVLLLEAQAILDEDREACRKIGEFGFELLRGHDAILTHCNAGGLATSEFGTALAPIYIGKERGKVFHVFADETRPLLQGARITAFELMAEDIPVTLLCDNMAASVMAAGKVDAVIVGADRIAANGDTANKIGTYGLAVIAKAHGVPFFVAAPFSTFDVSIKTGSSIPIELRAAEEITHGFGKRTAPVGARVYNPAFDVTPHKLITAIITERGVLRKPFERNIKRMKAGMRGEVKSGNKIFNG
jgi:methylthioribose-1-phosphate isomerase